MATITGTVDFVVGEETFQTWYQVYGDLKSGVRPVITLHGGPGIPHTYMLSHVDLYKLNGIPVIFYDQLGCGNSTHLRHKGKEFWTFELFMDELENLVAKLGIQDSYDVVGHSWGGMLAASFICARQPAGLKRLILFSTPSSMELWQKGTRSLLQGLPENVRESIEKHEAAGTTDSPEYQKAAEVFLAKHVCRIHPPPEDLANAFISQSQDPTVYSIMNGPSEFYITGTIKNWSIIDKLHTIKQPTLVINGAFDEAQDLCVAPLFQHIPKVKWVQFANSSHLASFEERERYMQVLSDFLKLEL
ncbi:proline-specific peptidase [Laetiporus sulphureus 93-53]|uniref:Proline-specific peptidase n=1 Tax=Laetiporus sulphureus 93-53 TaxID=1314785 RepID=A0A165EZ29_9APHY|nr:proline-specific peptidase [Laetiporus sulphureus 93-53]KZT08017.1 proline-specific peptidase [Laetiporus sulphureus 93-53]